MKTTHVVVSLSVLLNIILIVFIVTSATNAKPSSQKDERSRYRYLSPRIFIENQNDLLINFVSLRDQLREYHYRHQTHQDSRVGIYFEYLPTGTSIGIEETEAFVPASLLKLPLAMGVYKKIEEQKLDKNKTLTLQSDHLDKNFGTLWEKGAGHELTVMQAVESLIKQSDNTAQHVLYDQLQGDEIDNIFDALDIPKQRNDERNAVVTPKNYSSILRCLYLACYLTRDHSDELLHMLTETDFNDKLPSGVPSDIKVAHKIGVAVSPLNENKEVYTDCGIVYLPLRPYTLCVMTESNENHARVVMQDVSKIVYEYVSRANPPH